MRYEATESNLPGFWLVEAYNEKGECLRVVFSGPYAEQRAKDYAIAVRGEHCGAQASPASSGDSSGRGAS